MDAGRSQIVSRQPALRSLARVVPTVRPLTVRALAPRPHSLSAVLATYIIWRPSTLISLRFFSSHLFKQNLFCLSFSIHDRKFDQ